MSRTLIPIRWISAGPDGFTINIYVDSPLSSTEEAAIDAVVDAWLDASLSGAFGASRFHWLDKLPVFHGMLRYAMDPGRTDIERALEALRESLTRFAGVKVSEITIADEVTSL